MACSLDDAFIGSRNEVAGYSVGDTVEFWFSEHLDESGSEKVCHGRGGVVLLRAD